MKKIFDVTVCAEEDYMIEAETEEEAMELALKRFEKDFASCIEPEVESIK